MIPPSAEPSQPFALGLNEVLALLAHLDVVDRTARIFRLKPGVELGAR
jgi:hypothetical protein